MQTLAKSFRHSIRRQWEFWRSFAGAGLNAQGWNAPAIAKIFECCEHTVRATLRRWQSCGLAGLWDAPGRGDKPRWQVADLEYLEQALEQEQRTYNSQQLSEKLAQDRQVQLSADRIRRLFKGLKCLVCQ